MTCDLGRCTKGNEVVTWILELGPTYGSSTHGWKGGKGPNTSPTSEMVRRRSHPVSMAHAGDKRKHSNNVTDIAILKRWGDVKWIWGMRDDSDPETRARAEALLSVSGKIF